MAKDSRDENVGPQTSITQIGGADSLMSELKIQLAEIWKNGEDLDFWTTLTLRFCFTIDT